jgi:PAS domain S-box-containing protein
MNVKMRMNTTIDPTAANFVLKAILKNSESLFAAIDKDYRFTAFNQLFAEEFKKVYGIEIALGLSLAELLTDFPHEKEEALALWRRGLTGEEFTLTREFGEIHRKTYEIQFSPILDLQNEVIGTFQLVRDVSEKKLILQQLGMGEAKFDAVFDNIPSELRVFAEAMPQMAFIADKEGNITYYNQHHYNYFGINKGEAEHWEWTKINMHHPDDFAETISRWSTSIQKGSPYEMEYRLRRHDGVYRWHLARALPVKDSTGEIVRWIGTNTDIDEQKKVTQQLDELLKEVKYEKSRFEAIVQQMPAAVVIAEAPTGKLVFANDVMEKILGEDPIHSQNINEYALWKGFHPDGRLYEPLDWPLARSIMKGEVVNDEDVEIQRSNGSKIILRLSSSPLYNDKKEIIAGVVICQDVTELKEAIRSRDEFLSICSHELKTPLTSLKLVAQTVLRNIEKQALNSLAPDRMTKIFTQTETQVNRLSRLVEDMLDISRISANRISLDFVPQDLCKLVHDTVERMVPTFEESGAKLEMTVCEPISCTVDPFRIEQVLTNLLTNALKYGRNKTVKVKIESQDNVAVLSVEDQGLGIAKENFERIFDRYERLITASEASGLGLGLFITKKIVELHRGKIWVESELGVGSTFFVSLPLDN